MPSNPLLLSTAIEAVIKAGQIQMDFIDTGFKISKKGAIDLVTEADVAVETMFRKLIAERFPEHTILAEEFGEDAATRGASYCWVFDPIDGTNNYAHGLPIFCSSLALEIDGRGEIGAIYDPTRKELFVAERGGGAFLNGRPIHVSAASTLVESMLVTGFPYDIHKRIPEIVGLFGAVILEEAGGTVTDFIGGPFSSRRPQLLATNGSIHAEMLELLRTTTQRHNSW